MVRAFNHLTLDERRLLARLRDAGVPVSRIAERLGRHVSTIYRELKRNHFADDVLVDVTGYFAVVANDFAKERRARGAKLRRDPGLAAFVVDRLRAAWSPEQIAGHLRRRSSGPRICHETIYRHVYGPDGRRDELFRLLPTGRRRRRPRFARKPRGLFVPEANTIAVRPATIGQRTDFGHWEGDLVAFGKEFGKANLTSLVERKSRFLVLARNPSRHSAGVMSGIASRLGELPPLARRSITFDRGTEFAFFSTLKRDLGIDSWFCKPQAPWQKGSVENTNGRLRRFLPRHTDLATVSERDLRAIGERLNATPRKCLGFRSPREVLEEWLAEGAG